MGIVVIIMVVAWDDIEMIMPDMLVSSRFVMLAEHDPITPVFCFHCQGDFSA